MNYRHAFHAGNHADVLKHLVLLALCDALAIKPAACFALDTHAGRGLYRLEEEQARRTGEALDGIGRLGDGKGAPAAVQRYLEAVAACRRVHGTDAYPGSPWLLAHALREQDAIACCELHPEEAAALRAALRGERRLAVHGRDGYSAMRALLPPRAGDTRYARGLVLMDPPYERQLDEFDAVMPALREGLACWPQACLALWYPIKQRRSLQPFLRRASALEARSALACELLVRADDSPLRMNGSGMLLLNPPWRIEQALDPALADLRERLGEAGAGYSLRWLRAPA